MKIPIAPVMLDSKDTAMTGTLTFNGYVPALNDTRELKGSVTNASERFGRGSPIVMVDIKGIIDKEADAPALKKMRSRKMDTWIMTGITSLDDVFDVFCIGIGSLMMPYHTVTSDSMLSEICGMSDSTVPAVFTKGYEAASAKGTENVMSVLRKLRILGYDTAGVFDISGTFDETMWEKARGEFDGIIPYAHGRTPDAENSLLEMFPRIFTAL